MRVLELIAPAFLVITLAGFSTHVGSAQTPKLECAQLSNPPDDGSPLAAGLEVLASKKIDPSQVESACRSALSRQSLAAANDVCGLRLKLRRFSAAVATRREGQLLPRSGPVIQRQRWGRARTTRTSSLS